MRRIRYLSLLTMLLCSFVVWGQDDFDPASPAEPGVAPRKLTVVAVPSDGGTAYGSGRYVPETTVGLRVSSATGYVFEKWTDEEGNVLSTSGSYGHVKEDCDEVLTAHFVFSPSAPSEPAEPALTQYFRLTLAAEMGGSVSGGGKYLAGKTVSVSASVDEGFKFVNWTNSKGEVVSTSRSFSYTTTAENETLTAHFVFDPSNPSEPSDPILRHNITVSTEDGGTVSVGSKRLLEGTSTTLSATANDGYVFVGWYLNGELYTTLRSFSYTMGKENVVFEAVFEFSPASPSEPSMPEDKMYSFYLMTVIGKPGDVLDVPLTLSNLDDLYDMTFQVTFPLGLTPDLENVYLSDKATGYEVSFTAVDDTMYVFSMIGGTMPAGSSELLRFRVTVPEDYATGTSGRVKINQVSVTEADGTHLTASTRNGRIAVYKRGDTNGDNVVNITDAMNLITNVLEQDTEVFIEEVSDVNEDKAINVTDAMGVVNIALEE